MSLSKPRSSKAGDDTAALRRQNTARVLRCLRSDGPGSRADLAKRTGMAKATIGTIIGDLVDLGAVVESESLAEGRGRPGRPIRFVEGAYVGLGFELNVDYVAAVALDLAGDVVLSEVRPLVVGESRPESLLALAREVAGVWPGRTLVGATLAIPGLVGPDNRTMSWTPNLGLEGSTLADDLEKALVVEEAAVVG